jgi:hypothetical protein
VPPVEAMDLEMDAVVWRRTGSDRHSRPFVAALGVEYPARWTWRRRQVTDAGGRKLTADGTLNLDVSVPLGSWVWPGKLSEIPGTSYVPETGLYVILTASETPDVNGSNARYEYAVARAGDTLPTP